jgi:hypothetical protein
MFERLLKISRDLSHYLTLSCTDQSGFKLNNLQGYGISDMLKKPDGTEQNSLYKSHGLLKLMGSAVLKSRVGPTFDV